MVPVPAVWPARVTVSELTLIRELYPRRVMARLAASCDVLLAGFGRATRYARLAFHGGPDNRLTRAPGGAHPAHMLPFLIGGVVVILFMASRVWEAAGDAEPDSWSWRERAVVTVVGVLALLVVEGLLFALAMASS